MPRPKREAAGDVVYHVCNRGSRKGSLFETPDDYAVWRYVERNPVAAGLVSRVELWQWSSASDEPRTEPILDPPPVDRPAQAEWLALLNASGLGV